MKCNICILSPHISNHHRSQLTQVHTYSKRVRLWLASYISIALRDLSPWFQLPKFWVLNVDYTSVISTEALIHERENMRKNFSRNDSFQLMWLPLIRDRTAASHILTMSQHSPNTTHLITFEQIRYRISGVIERIHEVSDFETTFHFICGNDSGAKHKQSHSLMTH